MIDEGARSQEPLNLVGRVVATYEHFARLQQQKLLMADYVLERQAEIDDPMIATRSILIARYPHIEAERIDKALVAVQEPISRAVSKDGPADEERVGELVDAFERCEDVLPDGYGLACFVTFMQQSLAARRAGSGHTDDFRNSQFTGLIADFESFMVSLLTDLYNNEPRKLASKERSISWSEMFAIEDLEAFREQMIDSAVVDIMRGSFPDWMSSLERDHDVSVPQYISSPQVVEMFQRRHVLMHNGGRVSRLYVEKCPKVAVQPGEILTVPSEYLQASADRLAVIALALTVNALLKIPGAGEPGATEARMADWVYELLLRRRYQAVHDYLAKLPLQRMVNQLSVEICRVNRWLSLKRLGRFDECRLEVEAWQVDHLGDQYRLAKHALLGELDDAVDLCRRMRSEGRLSIKHWVEWPLLQEVREYEAETPGSQDAVVPGMASAPLVDSGDCTEEDPLHEH